MKKRIQAWRYLHRCCSLQLFPRDSLSGWKEAPLLGTLSCWAQGKGRQLLQAEQGFVWLLSLPFSRYVLLFPQCPAPSSYSKCFRCLFLPLNSGCKDILSTSCRWSVCQGLRTLKIDFLDYPLFHCSWNTLNYKGWSQEWCNSYGAINQYSHCEYPGGKL